MGEKTGYRTVGYCHNMSGDFPCLLCGKRHEQAYAAVKLLEVDAKGNERNWGDLCPDCIEAGPAGAAERMRQYVLDMVHDLAILVDLSAEVATIAEWADTGHLQAATMTAQEIAKGRHSPYVDDLDDLLEKGADWRPF